MEENIKILDNWYKSISDFKKLNYNEAKQLFIKVSEEKDENKKLKLREELINGTLYIVYDNLKTSKYTYIKATDYDMNDIISASVIAWIKIIDSGRILKCNNFSRLLINSAYHLNLEKFVIQKENNDFLGAENFGLFIYWFLKKKERKENVSYDEVKFHIKNYHSNLNDDRINILYNSLNNFCDYCTKNGIDLNTSKRKLMLLRHFIVDLGNDYDRENINDFQTKSNIEKDFENQNLKEKLLGILNSNILNNKQKYILYYSFFANGKEKMSCEEIMKNLNISHARIFQIREEAITKIKKHLEVK